MVQLATAAIGALTAGASTVASGVSSAFGLGAPLNLAPAAAGSGLGSTLLSVGQAGLGLVGAMGAIRSSQAMATAYRGQAADSLLQANQTQIDATNKDTSLRKALVATIGQRDTAYAASGVDASFGTPVQARAQAESQAAGVMSQDDESADVARAQYIARANNFTAMADDSEDAGWLKAIGSIGTAGLGIAQRG